MFLEVIAPESKFAGKSVRTICFILGTNTRLLKDNLKIMPISLYQKNIDDIEFDDLVSVCLYHLTGLWRYANVVNLSLCSHMSCWALHKL